MKQLSLLILLISGILSSGMCHAYRFREGGCEIDGNTFRWYTFNDETITLKIREIKNPHMVIPSRITINVEVGYMTYRDMSFIVTSIEPASGRTGYTDLKSVHLPPTIRTIGSNTFYNCSSLTSISGQNVQSIGEKCFKGCSSLKSVIFPNLESIGPYGFSDCKSILNVSLPNLQTIKKYSFLRCYALRNITCHNVRSIGDGAFSDCWKLETISLRDIQDMKSPFYGCSSIMSIIVDNEIPPIVDGGLFYSDMYTQAHLYVPQSAIETYRATDPWSRFFISSEMDKYTYTDFQEADKRRDVKMKGVTADGKSQLLIIGKNFPDISLSDLSVVVTIDGVEIRDEKLVGTIGELRQYGNNKIGFVYTAPDGYAGQDNSSSYTIEINLLTPEGERYSYAGVEIWRPGVLFLHGLFSNEDCWNDAITYLKSSGSYNSSQLLNFAYKTSNTAAFNDNTYTYKVVENGLNRLYTQLLSQKIVSTRFDLVGHSMGGILSRKYAQEINSAGVNRILTFNTPHSGSQFGELGKDVTSVISSVVDGYAVANPALGVTGRGLLAWVKREFAAISDLSPNSEAIKILNSPTNVAKASGIPVHAACTSFDGTGEQTSNNEKTPKPMDAALGLWFNRMKNVEPNSDSGYSLLNRVLQTEYHDGVVPLESQCGGLSLERTASVITDKYPFNGSFGGFDSNAHHCKMTHWDANHSRLISLLRAHKDDGRFADSFAPVDLSENISHLPISRAEKIDSPSESFIRITASRANDDPRIVNVKLETNDDVINKGALCVIDENRVLLSDYEDECSFNIPSDFSGELEIIGIGYTSNDSWVTDGVVLDFDDVVNPYSIQIEDPTPLIMIEGETIEPQVSALWYSGEQSFVKATLGLIDSDGCAEINDGKLKGIREGSCRMVANYREATDTINVRVLKSLTEIGGISEKIEHVAVEDSGCIQLFLRGDKLVVRMVEGYEGMLDLEIFNLAGQLMSHNMVSGSFADDEEIVFGLQSPMETVQIVRCRRDDGVTETMKIFR